LEACEEKGWEVLHLAAKELTRLIPELWATERAAEDWAENNPLNPSISVIRLWRVIYLYRPTRRRGKRSSALVRRGVNPRMALRAVRGSPPRIFRCESPPELAQVPSVLTPRPSP
jgi:hypothetical protein